MGVEKYNKRKVSSNTEDYDCRHIYILKIGDDRKGSSIKYFSNQEVRKKKLLEYN